MATANPGSAPTGSSLPPAAFIPAWRIARELTPASDAALVADAVAQHAATQVRAGDLPLQGAAPDPRIRLEECPQPVQVANPDELLGKAVDAAMWTTTHRSFPGGAEWEVNALNAQAWAGHRFEGHFSERVLRMIANPEGHPLFELRLDLLQYEVLFARFLGAPHNPLSVRWEVPARNWRRDIRRGDPDLERHFAEPQPWTPDCYRLAHCLRMSCRDYAEGLALYLLPGREHWGGG